ncbi:hypothetical protein GCM10015535_64630 [Streptomyces gelaticus]|uniref:Uncharacterized protein n=1 Tax=Streptomyces gelaticus TaxID=285446 RepID=A0ABQ2WBG5_9ACTN|nr:hypothetical protein GCM10015535_64630 [Streptomyces gelaticus]
MPDTTRPPACEQLTEILRESPRFNACLNSPPSPTQVTSHDLSGPRGAFRDILDAFFDSPPGPRTPAAPEALAPPANCPAAG